MTDDEGQVPFMTGRKMSKRSDEIRQVWRRNSKTTHLTPDAFPEQRG
jgi:hypothetical protein